MVNKLDREVEKTKELGRRIVELCSTAHHPATIVLALEVAAATVLLTLDAPVEEFNRGVAELVRRMKGKVENAG